MPTKSKIICLKLIKYSGDELTFVKLDDLGIKTQRFAFLETLDSSWS